jgi:hypothetical protein
MSKVALIDGVLLFWFCCGIEYQTKSYSIFVVSDINYLDIYFLFVLNS